MPNEPQPAPLSTNPKTATRRTRVAAVANLPPTSPPPNVTSLTVGPRDKSLLDIAAVIATDPPSPNDMAFSHAILCQVGLPRSKTNEREFFRRSGSAWITVSAGYLDEGKGRVAQPLPYGPMPRLTLIWLSTYAKRHNSRQIPLGDSAADFLRRMNMDDDGRRHRNLRKQIHALAACHLQLGFNGRTWNGQPIEQFDCPLSVADSRQRTLWPGVMTLSDSYFQSLVDSAVPLDNRALLALKGSSLGLDTYAWLAHRLHRIEGRGVPLHWKALREQFGQEYTGIEADKDFKKTFLPVLQKVLAVYPKANVRRVTGGLLLLSSPPPIPYKGCGKQLWIA
jgi:hypothetical protein